MREWGCAGGQKARVQFSRVTAEQPHVLVLDEPTNHLDVETIESLYVPFTTLLHPRYMYECICSLFFAGPRSVAYILAIDGKSQ